MAKTISPLARELRRLRAEKGFTMRALAQRAGVSTKTITQIETGRQNPSALTIAKLARGLGVPSSGLLEVGDADASPKAPAPPSPADSPGERRSPVEEPDALTEIVRRLSAWGQGTAGSGVGSVDLMRDLALMDDAFEEVFEAYRSRLEQEKEADELARAMQELVAASDAVEEALREAAAREADPEKVKRISDYLDNKRSTRASARSRDEGRARSAS